MRKLSQTAIVTNIFLVLCECKEFLYGGILNYVGYIGTWGPTLYRFNLAVLVLNRLRIFRRAPSTFTYFWRVFISPEYRLRFHASSCTLI